MQQKKRKINILNQKWADASKDKLKTMAGNFCKRKGLIHKKCCEGNAIQTERNQTVRENRAEESRKTGAIFLLSEETLSLKEKMLQAKKNNKKICTKLEF